MQVVRTDPWSEMSATQAAPTGRPLSALARWLTRFGERDLPSDISVDERRALFTTNIACILLFVLTSPYALLFAAFGEWTLALLVAPLCVSYIVTVALIRRGRTNLGRSILLPSITISIFVFCLMLGPQSRLETAFFLAVAGPFLFFPASRPRWIFAHAPLPILAYLLLHSVAYEWVEPLDLSTSQIELFNLFITPTTALLVLIPLFYLLRTQNQAEQRLTIDNAARRLAEGEVRRLSESSMRAQENERRNLAMALHDGATQTLVAASMWTKELAREATPALLPKVQMLEEIIANVMSDLRQLSHDLRPSVLDELGLSVALRELANQFTTPTCTVDFTCEPADLGSLHDDLCIALFRIAQTALGNVGKHSGADQVTMVLRLTPTEVQLEIADNGIGFEAAGSPSGLLPETVATNKEVGLGLISIRERATWLGGTSTVTSAPTQGTRIDVRVPKAPSCL